MNIEGVDNQMSTETEICLITRPDLTDEVFQVFIKKRGENPILQQVHFGNKDGMLLVRFSSGEPSFADGLKEAIQETLNEAENAIKRQKTEADQAAKMAVERRNKIVSDAAKTFGIPLLNDNIPRSQRRHIAPFDDFESNG
jgi:hypothetical protein